MILFHQNPSLICIGEVTGHYANFYANVQSYKKYSIYARLAREKLTKNDKKVHFLTNYDIFSIQANEFTIHLTAYK